MNRSYYSPINAPTMTERIWKIRINKPKITNFFVLMFSIIAPDISRKNLQKVMLKKSLWSQRAEYSTATSPSVCAFTSEYPRRQRVSECRRWRGGAVNILCGFRRINKWNDKTNVYKTMIPLLLREDTFCSIGKWMSITRKLCLYTEDWPQSQCKCLILHPRERGRNNVSLNIKVFYKVSGSLSVTLPSLTLESVAPTPF